MKLSTAKIIGVGEPYELQSNDGSVIKLKSVYFTKENPNIKGVESGKLNISANKDIKLNDVVNLVYNSNYKKYQLVEI